MMSGIAMISMGKKIANFYAGLCEPICRKYGINQTCFDVLMFCANNPEYNTARDICAVRGIKSGIASVAVETLIGAGLMERQTDSADRRIHRLVPAPCASSLIDEGRAMQASFAGVLRRGISDDELLALDNIHRRLERNISDFELNETNKENPKECLK